MAGALFGLGWRGGNVASYKAAILQGKCQVASLIFPVAD